ncbi:hypothetical protein [Pseudomonas fluorescens]|uniref:hypothetical protein n=1 Tax=Pseudomonas fluorescens TaxID=294 RepID=UPI000CA1A6DB|nr:hypothetical protein [Pseudomonas fluorescens]AUM71239.1 hypothetical protein C0J56_21940 [Pseudomonas fluorescens]
MRPTIVSVKDANNNEVPEDILKRYTVSTRLKLSGQASKGRKVAIIDNFDEFLLGEATASSLTGTWELSLTVEVNHYLFFAKALYPVDGSAYSNKRQVYVVPLISPTLDRVRDSNEQEIPDGHNTSSTQLRLNGKASRGQTVEIFDGSGASAVSKGEVTSDVTLGNWMLIITVDRGPHRFYAKSLYHSGAPVYSNVRTLTVVRP